MTSLKERGDEKRQWRVTYKRVGKQHSLRRTFENEATARRWERFLQQPLAKPDEYGVPDYWAELVGNAPVEWIRVSSRVVGPWEPSQ